MKTPSSAALAAENKRLVAELARAHNLLLSLSDEVKHYKALAEGSVPPPGDALQVGARADLRQEVTYAIQ